MNRSSKFAMNLEETPRDRIAQLPIGMILFIVLIGLMAYYLDSQPKAVRAEQTRPAQTAVH